MATASLTMPDSDLPGMERYHPNVSRPLTIQRINRGLIRQAEAPVSGRYAAPASWHPGVPRWLGCCSIQPFWS